LLFTLLLIPLAIWPKRYDARSHRKVAGRPQIGVAFSPFPHSEKSDMMLITGSTGGRRSRHGVYRWLLRVQTINAEIRPTNVSRIISKRIMLDPPFRFQRRPGLDPGLSCLKLQCFAQEPASSLSEES
jgi:hypothetical protein